MYPVITMEAPAVHAGSRDALLGAKPSAAMVQLMSVEKQVSAATPPTLLIHSQDDGLVPADNSILYFQALTRAKVPAEMFIFDMEATAWPCAPGTGLPPTGRAAPKNGCATAN